MKKLITPLLLLASICSNAQPFTFTRIDVNPGNANSNPRAIGSIGGKVIFSAYHATYGNELWITDGTQAGTQLLKDINAGIASSDPGSFGYATMNGKIYFTAGNTTFGGELWMTDGTAAGTQLVKDIYPGTNNSINSKTGMIAINNKLYFSAADNINGLEPWVSDGTVAGTQLLYDINPGTQHSNPGNFIALNSNVIFSAYNTYGYQLWSTNGTTAGTQLGTIMYPGIACTADYKFTIMNNKAYYFGCSDTVGTELWVTDGTVAGTALVKDIEPGVGSSYSTISLDYQNIVALNGKLYFSAYNYVDGIEPWVSDGTNAGTQLLKDIETGVQSSGAVQFVVHNNKVYFNAANTTIGPELWSTDGTGSGTNMVKDIYPGPSGSLPMTDKLYLSQGKYLFFTTQNNPTTNSDVQLWITDGTSTGTKNIRPASNTTVSPLNGTHAMYAHTDGSVYLDARYDNTGNELWIIKDTSSSTGIAATTISNTIMLYPNPAHHNFTIITTTAFIKGSVTLTDATGKVLIDKHPISNTQSLIPLNNIAPGTYIANVWLDDKQTTQKLVIE